MVPLDYGILIMVIQKNMVEYLCPIWQQEKCFSTLENERSECLCGVRMGQVVSSREEMDGQAVQLPDLDLLSSSMDVSICNTWLFKNVNKPLGCMYLL